jgi:hypothetical protein
MDFGPSKYKIIRRYIYQLNQIHVALPSLRVLTLMKKNQEGIQAAIPEISNSVISALKAHDLTFPTTQCVNDTTEHADPDTNSTPLQPSQTHLQNETTTYPALNRPTGQRGNNNVANAETLHHFLNSGIDNFHDITRPNIGNSILHWMLIYVKLTTQ